MPSEAGRVQCKDSPTSSDMDVAEPSPVAEVGLDQLKLLHSQLVEALGTNAGATKALQVQIQAKEEQLAQPKALPGHVQVAKAERKLAGLHQKLEKQEGMLDALEKQKAAIEDQIAGVKSKGSEILLQISNQEQERDQAIQAMSNQVGLAGVSAIQKGFLQDLGIDLQLAGSLPQCRDLLQQLEIVAGQLKQALQPAPSSGAEETLVEESDATGGDQLDGTATPVYGSMGGGHEDGQ